jgi:hypothetical protein
MKGSDDCVNTQNRWKCGLGPSSGNLNEWRTQLGSEALRAECCHPLRYRTSSLYGNQRFGGTYHLRLQGRKSAEQEASVEQLARQNFVNHLKMKVIRCYETSIHARR